MAAYRIQYFVTRLVRCRITAVIIDQRLGGGLRDGRRLRNESSDRSRFDDMCTAPYCILDLRGLFCSCYWISSKRSMRQLRLQRARVWILICGWCVDRSCTQMRTMMLDRNKQVITCAVTSHHILAQVINRITVHFRATASEHAHFGISQHRHCLSRCSPVYLTCVCRACRRWGCIAGWDNHTIL